MKPIHAVMIYSPIIPNFSTHQCATSPKDTEAPNFAKRRAASVINKLPLAPPLLLPPPLPHLELDHHHHPDGLKS